MQTAPALPGIGSFILASGEATITLSEKQVTVNGGAVHLTPSELRLFIALAQKLGGVMTDRELLTQMAAATEDVHSNSVRLSKIRKALRKAHPDAATVLPCGARLIPSIYFVSPRVAPIEPVERFRFTHGGTTIVMYENGALYVSEKLINLTEKEQEVFIFLAEHAGKTCTKDMLLGHLYDAHNVNRAEYKILDVLVCHIRAKLFAASADTRGFIETVWGRGYVLGEPAAPDSLETARPANPEASVVIGAGIYARTYTRDDLPNPNCRWVMRRKAVVIGLLDQGGVTMEELLVRFPDLTVDEIRNWRRRFHHGGLPGLRVTRNAA